MSNAATYKIVATAWKEGRLENVLERQKELAALHRNLRKERVKLGESLTRDFPNVQVFSDAEIDLTLESIKDLYDSIDFKSTLAAENSVRRGESQMRRLVAKGISLIVPTQCCPILSILAPLAASIAAGGVALVLPLSSAVSTFDIIHGIIKSSVDPEAITIAPNASSEGRLELARKHFDITVLQDLDADESLKTALQRTNPSIQILQPGWGVAAIFIDRSVRSLADAASHIFRATKQATLNKLTTPRIAFVDEFLLEELKTMLERSHPGFAETTEELESSSRLALFRELRKSFPLSLESLKSKDQSNLIALRTNGPINPLELYKIAVIVAQLARNLLLVPVRSIDQGIDIFNKMNGRLIPQAIYIFAGGKEGQYISQFANSQHIFFNQIPLSSLVSIWPRSPNNYGPSPYRVEDFCENRSLNQVRLRKAGSTETSVSSNPHTGKIYQPEGGAMNFFDKGLLVGFAVSLIMICGSAYITTRSMKAVF